MGIEIHWTDFAKKELKNIFDYHKKRVSYKLAKKITKEIIEKTKHLSSFPEIGVIEELLKDRSQEFRYLICKNYKIIYCLNKDKIEIIDVFDTRQNPIKLKRNK